MDLSRGFRKNVYQKSGAAGRCWTKLGVVGR
jgi:hypothetical protein